MNFLRKIPVLKKEFEWFEWFEWFGPSPIEPFNSGHGSNGALLPDAPPHPRFVLLEAPCNGFRVALEAKPELVGMARMIC